MSNEKLPAGFPSEPLSEAEEKALAQEIRWHHKEEDISKLALHTICEAVPYIKSCCRGAFHQDELISVAYSALYNAAKNYVPGPTRFFPYAKAYLRGMLNRHWKAQDVVKGSSLHETVVDAGVHPLESNETEYPFYELDLKEKWNIIIPTMRKKLTDRERMIVELVAISGYSYSRVSTLVVPKITRQAVEICYQRAVKRLRLALREIATP